MSNKILILFIVNFWPTISNKRTFLNIKPSNKCLKNKLKNLRNFRQNTQKSHFLQKTPFFALFEGYFGGYFGGVVRTVFYAGTARIKKKKEWRVWGRPWAREILTLREMLKRVQHDNDWFNGRLASPVNKKSRPPVPHR